MRVCARVLAAALIAGAVAGALAFPAALFTQGEQENRALVAPPSSQQRTIRVPALRLPAQQKARHPVRAAAPPAAQELATVHIAAHSAAPVHRPEALPARPDPPV